jgi:hypothetical protein
MAEYGLVDADMIPAILGRIFKTTDIEEACAESSIVFQSTPEPLGQKQRSSLLHSTGFASPRLVSAAIPQSSE